MKIPKAPPDFQRLLKEAMENQDHFFKIVSEIPVREQDTKQYLHWDELRHLEPPEGYTRQEWWLAIKWHRMGQFRSLPLLDSQGMAFKFGMADPIPALLHEIDLGAGGQIQMPDQITNPETRDQYCIGSLIEEAITSSQLEGATTTRLIAKEMIKQGRPPRDRSEQMILNNFMTMRRIGKLRNEPLTKELVFEIHRLVTDQALDDNSAAGRFRNAAEKVGVYGMYNEVFHEPPLASELEKRMEAMCAFANGEIPAGFVHPVIRSIVLHFWLAYDHPFVDGNGRTARALFYWSMLRHKYWLAEYISISQIIKKAPVKYGKAFLYTEHDENDLTYFIRYHLHVIRQAVTSLHEYISRKSRELQAIQAELRGMGMLNHRQKALISHALRHPRQHYLVKSHCISHNVVYETARTDLIDLVKRGLLVSTKTGKTLVFTAVPNLHDRLSELSPTA